MSIKEIPAKLVELAMPTVMVDEYIPEVCRTLESRQKHIEMLLPKSRLMKPYPGMKSYAELRVASDTGNRKWFYAVDTRVNDIVYLMHLNPLRMNLKKVQDAPQDLKRFAMYQGSVWRADGCTLIIGMDLPKGLFWKLFKGNQNWFSDAGQSKDGKRFWERRISEAIERGHLVYAVHFNETREIEVDKIVQITNETDSIEHYWTYEKKKDDSGMYWRFAITHP